MRNQRGSGYSSREQRRKSKTDRMLTLIIGIVSLLILAVGCIILISVFHTSPSTTPSSQSKTASIDNKKSKTTDSSKSSSESDSGQASNEESSSDSSSSASQEADENHQASYEMGSEDWNAQVHAIAEATGIDEANMTIRWLGNGGSPNSSLARVSPKNDQSAIYVVHLIYQDGHWQADNVKKP
ncbi:YrrS family protein [Sporolactobacillus kofuensis]|uniref:YrrS family protein n=1 Tax=Sporolactobacillus kofuensis TaxID=269672 RepID=A0ABW1W955_9BACL|nr:YrrS family protein [Sporolactobacillus kofuensis]MCO7175641.1 YrrS family protein [Sporolactobacillus kofuensis]